MKRDDLQRPRCRRLKSRDRRGAVVVLTAFLLIVMMALLAFSIDLGYMQNARVEIDRAVDAGALAGAGLLVQGTDDASNAARDFAQMNPVAGRPLTDAEVDITVGEWDKQNRQFSTTEAIPFAVHVRAERTNVRPFFARALGRNSFSVASEAVAMYQPRDIVVVLDYSASMNDDSEFRSIDVLGQETVESNLQTIYEELGSPVYGSLQLAPKWLTVTGTPPSNTYKPQLAVEYRYQNAYVTSTKPFHSIRIYRSSSSYTTVTGAGTYNAAIGKYERTVTYNSSSQITKLYVKSGYKSSSTASSNQYDEWFYFDSASTIRSHVKTSFGLNAVTYPNPGGSWDEYIDYCRSSSNNSNAGYYYKFGYLNLINYWLEQRPKASESPNLWQTSEQPITALKNSVSVFLSFLQEMETEDRVALAVYNSSSGEGILERGLDQQFDQIETISRQRQAGHYHSNTNIGAGLYQAWNELEDNARTGAFKMIVLMTDGQANMPSSDPTGYVYDQVEECQSRGYPVVTVSLGAGADTSIMQNVADSTGGLHFNVPGGRPSSEYEAELKEVFRKIAEKRPLQLVK